MDRGDPVADRHRHRIERLSFRAQHQPDSLSAAALLLWPGSLRALNTWHFYHPQGRTRLGYGLLSILLFRAWRETLPAPAIRSGRFAGPTSPCWERSGRQPRRMASEFLPFAHRKLARRRPRHFGAGICPRSSRLALVVNPLSFGFGSQKHFPCQDIRLTAYFFLLLHIVTLQ